MAHPLTELRASEYQALRLKLEDYTTVNEKVFTAALLSVSPKADHKVLAMVYHLIDEQCEGAVTWQGIEAHVAAVLAAEADGMEAVQNAGQADELFRERATPQPAMPRQCYHKGRIGRIVAARDPSRLVTFSDDGTVRAWCSRTLQFKGALLNGRCAVTDIEYDPGSDVLAALSCDHVVSLFRTADGRPLQTFRLTTPRLGVGGGDSVRGAEVYRHELRIPAATPPNPYAALPTESVLRRRWAERNNQFLQRVWAHERQRTSALHATLLQVPDYASAVSGYDPTGQGAGYHLMLGHESGVVRSYATDALEADAQADGQARLLSEWAPHKSAVTCIRCDAEREVAMTAGADSDVHVMHLERGIVLRTMRGTDVETLRSHSRGVRGIEYARPHRIVATWGQERFPVLWDPDAGKALQALHGHVARVVSVSFAPVDDHIVITAAEDRTVRIWDTRNFRCLQVLRDTAADGLAATHYCALTRSVVTAGQRLYTRPARAASFAVTYQGHTEAVLSVQGGDARTVITCDERCMKVWRLGPPRGGDAAERALSESRRSRRRTQRGQSVVEQLMARDDDDAASASLTSARSILSAATTRPMTSPRDPNPAPVVVTPRPGGREPEVCDPSPTLVATFHPAAFGSLESVCLDTTTDAAAFEERREDIRIATTSNGQPVMVLTGSRTIGGRRYTYDTQREMWVVATGRAVLWYDDVYDRRAVHYAAPRVRKHFADPQPPPTALVTMRHGVVVGRRDGTLLYVSIRDPRSAPADSFGFTPLPAHAPELRSYIAGPLHGGVAPVVETVVRAIDARRRAEGGRRTVYGAEGEGVGRKDSGGSGSGSGSDDEATGDDDDGPSDAETDGGGGDGGGAFFAIGRQVTEEAFCIECAAAIDNTPLVVTGNGGGALAIASTAARAVIVSWFVGLRAKASISAVAVVPGGGWIVYGDEMGYGGVFDIRELHVAYAAVAARGAMVETQQTLLALPWASLIQRVAFFRAAPAPINALRWLPSHNSFLVGTADGRLQCFDIHGCPVAGAWGTGTAGAAAQPFEAPPHAVEHAQVVDVFRMDRVVAVVAERPPRTPADVARVAALRYPALFPAPAVALSVLDSVSAVDGPPERQLLYVAEDGTAHVATPADRHDPEEVRAAAAAAAVGAPLPGDADVTGAGGGAGAGAEAAVQEWSAAEEALTTPAAPWPLAVPSPGLDTLLDSIAADGDALGAGLVPPSSDQHQATSEVCHVAEAGVSPMASTVSRRVSGTALPTPPIDAAATLSPELRALQELAEAEAQARGRHLRVAAQKLSSLHSGGHGAFWRRPANWCPTLPRPSETPQGSRWHDELTHVLRAPKWSPELQLAWQLRLAALVRRFERRAAQLVEGTVAHQWHSVCPGGGPATRTLDGMVITCLTSPGGRGPWAAGAWAGRKAALNEVAAIHAALRATATTPLVVIPPLAAVVSCLGMSFLCLADTRRATAGDGPFVSPAGAGPVARLLLRLLQQALGIAVHDARLATDDPLLPPPCLATPRHLELAERDFAVHGQRWGCTLPPHALSTQRPAVLPDGDATAAQQQAGAAPKGELRLLRLRSEALGADGAPASNSLDATVPLPQRTATDREALRASRKVAAVLLPSAVQAVLRHDHRGQPLLHGRIAAFLQARGVNARFFGATATALRRAVHGASSLRRSNTAGPSKRTVPLKGDGSAARGGGSADAPRGTGLLKKAAREADPLSASSRGLPGASPAFAVQLLFEEIVARVLRDMAHARLRLEVFGLAGGGGIGAVTAAPADDEGPATVDHTLPWAVDYARLGLPFPARLAAGLEAVGRLLEAALGFSDDSSSFWRDDVVAACNAKFPDTSSEPYAVELPDLDAARLVARFATIAALRVEVDEDAGAVTVRPAPARTKGILGDDPAQCAADLAAAAASTDSSGLAEERRVHHAVRSALAVAEGPDAVPPHEAVRWCAAVIDSAAKPRLAAEWALRVVPVLGAPHRAQSVFAATLFFGGEHEAAATTLRSRLQWLGLGDEPEHFWALRQLLAEWAAFRGDTAALRAQAEHVFSDAPAGSPWRVWAALRVASALVPTGVPSCQLRARAALLAAFNDARACSGTSVTGPAVLAVGRLVGEAHLALREEKSAVAIFDAMNACITAAVGSGASGAAETVEWAAAAELQRGAAQRCLERCAQAKAIFARRGDAAGVVRCVALVATIDASGGRPDVGAATLKRALVEAGAGAAASGATAALDARLLGPVQLLASLLERCGARQLDAALEWRLAVLAAVETHSGGRHVDTSEALGRVAEVLFRRGQALEALQLLEVARDTALAATGPRSPVAAALHFHAGRCLGAVGDVVGATRRFREALQVVDPSGGDGDRHAQLRHCRLMADLGLLLLADTMAYIHPAEVDRRRRQEDLLRRGDDAVVEVDVRRLKELGVTPQERFEVAHECFARALRFAAAYFRDAGHPFVRLLHRRLTLCRRFVSRYRRDTAASARAADQSKLLSAWDLLTDPDNTGRWDAAIRYRGRQKLFKLKPV